MHFTWVSKPDSRPANLSDSLPSASISTPVSKVRQTQRGALRRNVEQFLRDRGIHYVNVDEAQKSLFKKARLRAFHFVVYRQNGLNWLLYASQLRKETRRDLMEWEKVFGEGFVAVVAQQTVSARLRFRRISGEEITLNSK